MDLAYKSKYLTLAISCAAFLVIPHLYPFLRLFYFSPFLIIMYYQQDYLKCLWWSFICGLIFDLFSFSIFPGMNALIYTLTTAVLYRQRIYFFSDSLSTMPLMAFFFAIVATILFWGLAYTFENKTYISGEMIYTDLFVMPVIDSVYAFLCFIAPSMIFAKRKFSGRRWT